MNSIFKNTLAVIIGLFVGSVVNMAIILMSSSVIPPPNGADVTTMEGLKATMHLFEPKHFIFPFLAHAIGTFAGALTTVLIAASHQTKLALLIGAFFLLGGIVNVYTLPSPVWFSAIDLIFAYLPTAFLASKLVQKKKL
ncbi:hypothetical protein BC749_10543 [Flavobacterium araucananum]|jgi:hypothetical protein|uniref:Uncharacterized protein n=1 Tax=Flavobacterium araucananum TaxID=946678 RepID=A0A227NX62_9FLAO|nr:hypothetical protein [Flavobacterium araucananum]OXG02280.1 hypothetical protein B0A64_18605 [Flavobacterium araucananum]PWJ98217.1 hypothetical protein BC749_10543 [Flavobacterium araucananum]